MHYVAVVVGPDVERQLEPFEDHAVRDSLVDESGSAPIPKGRYDYYEIGGRFADSFLLKAGGAATAADAADVAWEATLAGDLMPFAVLADATWRDRGWDHENDEDFDRWAVPYLTGLPAGMMVTIVDCHF